MNTARTLLGGLAGIVLVVGIFGVSPAHAQFGLRGIESAISITFEPAHPREGDTVRLTARSSVFILSEADITWNADGKKIAGGRGVESADVTVGVFGSETDVEVSAETPDGTTAVAQATIVPTSLDLLVDSDSYVPPFYRGGVRASAGTSLLLEARPRFVLSGRLMPASELLYTWKRNGEVLGYVSGRGQSSVRIPSPHLFGTDTITVEVRTDDELLANERSVSISSVVPVLALYVDHPLFGIRYERALPASVFLQESEATFAAVPYFAQARNINDSALRFAWRVNDTPIAPSPSNPSEITINANNSTGLAHLDLVFTHATNLYTDVKKAWNINLSTGAVPQDQFHDVNFGQ